MLRAPALQLRQQFDGLIQNNRKLFAACVIRRARQLLRHKSSREWFTSFMRRARDIKNVKVFIHSGKILWAAGLTHFDTHELLSACRLKNRYTTVGWWLTWSPSESSHFIVIHFPRHHQGRCRFLLYRGKDSNHKKGHCRCFFFFK